ncbi:M15 family metallopeptidase [Clostridium formicaceticum]|uniref:D-alanyl-D-alanine carboxypeptidase n=1 Tax=Clostridium formicaceticum TaxID=1497 RepID=A0AAC9WID7_9CLOT|nr:M15 family metallopeptidase [Clostridium formicaceticum]AOY78016.1 peptidase M15 [Clostridium formicaceticum]ARE88650.1 D-alanyl-D-alanine carboxypeptidase [Clostridium formicaceticum]
MKTIELTRKKIYKGHLILVNQQYPIHEEVITKNHRFVPVDESHEDIFLELRSAVMLSQLIKACKAEDSIVPISGYRSLQEQQEIFQNSMRENGEAFTLKYVALPNCSEHQTGFAIDVAEKKQDIDFICPDFPYHGICQKFREKAADFGFIERYQKGKEAITGIGQEPWHFRYVGYPHSKIIENLKLTLEEYIDLLRNHIYNKNPLLFQEKGREIQVSYVNLIEENSVTVQEPNGMWQISGNNVDGGIITVWGENDERQSV